MKKESLSEKNQRIIRSIDEIDDTEKWAEENLGLPSANMFQVYSDDFQEYNCVYECDEFNLPKDYLDMKFYRCDTEEDRDRTIEEIKSRGLDTYNSKILAIYNDPEKKIPKVLIDDISAIRVQAIIHENTHAHLQMVSLSQRLLSLEEAMADTIGVMGAYDYIKEKYGIISREYQGILDDIDENNKYKKEVIRHYNRLNKIYNSKLSEPMKRRLKKLCMGHLKRVASNIFKKNMEDYNNARLTRDMTYSKFFPLTLKVYEKTSSTKEALKVFKSVAENIYELAIFTLPSERDEKLEQLAVSELEDYLAE